MIFIVDDDNDILNMLAEVVRSDGYFAGSFGSADEALNAAVSLTPRLIISDIMMPEMDGFAFRQEYLKRFPLRKTPFIFLSSLSDPDTIVRGLDSGADDYIVKPVNGDVLKARIRSIIARSNKTAPSPAVFNGDLSKFPLARIMQFCELKGFTGIVEVEQDGHKSRLSFKGGNPDLSDAAADAEFEHMYDLTEGIFSIMPEVMDFSEIADVAVERHQSTKTEAEKPMGRLSGIQVGSRLFQVQTEFVVYPDELLLSLVILDGKVVLKRSTPVDHSLDKSALDRLISEQHLSVEDEIRNRIENVAQKKTAAAVADSPSEKFNYLLETGFDRYRDKDYASALEYWEQARLINPSDKTLEINIAVVRKKLQA